MKDQVVKPANVNMKVANKNTPPSVDPGGVKPGVSYADALKKGTGNAEGMPRGAGLLKDPALKSANMNMNVANKNTPPGSGKCPGPKNGKAEVSEKTYAEALKATGTDGAASWRVDAVARQKVPNGRMNNGPGSTAFVMKKGGGDSGSNAGRGLFSGRSTSTASGSGSGSSRVAAAESNASHRAPSQLSERPVGKREAISRDGPDSAKNAALSEKHKRDLREEMGRPHVKDSELWKIVDKLYKEKATTGSGSTAAAFRYEKITGKKVGGKLHGKKTSDNIERLEKWFRKNPRPDDKNFKPGKNKIISDQDYSVAENILKDMQDALK